MFNFDLIMKYSKMKCNYLGWERYTTASAVLHKNSAVDELHKHVFLIFSMYSS